MSTKPVTEDECEKRHKENATAIATISRSNAFSAGWRNAIMILFSAVGVALSAAAIEIFSNACRVCAVETRLDSNDQRITETAFNLRQSTTDIAEQLERNRVSLQSQMDKRMDKFDAKLDQLMERNAK